MEESKNPLRVKRLAVGREFDLLGRMRSLQSTPSSGPTMRFGYAYNDLNQRVQVEREDFSYWRYRYEAFGQVADALKTDSGSVAFPGFGYAFNYDTIGNRLSVAENEELTEYISNALNQYTLITLPAPEPAQIPTYDLNGNMTHTGRDAYLWDEENRLVRMEYPDGSASEFDYDGLSRRMERREYDASGSLTETMRYVYDELLPIQELDGNQTVGRSYTRGLNLTQSLQGAGGVGGLLAMTESSGATFFYFYDGNGNVTDLIDDSDAPAAHYEYDPFGKVIAQTGTLDQPFQFSTKAYHAPSGMNHYLYRWYSPEMGRWPNRDPLGEKESKNLHNFVRNPIGEVDLFGLKNKGIASSTGVSAYNLATGMGFSFNFDTYEDLNDCCHNGKWLIDGEGRLDYEFNFDVGFGIGASWNGIGGTVKVLTWGTSISTSLQIPCGTVPKCVPVKTVIPILGQIGVNASGGFGTKLLGNFGATYLSGSAAGGVIPVSLNVDLDICYRNKISGAIKVCFQMVGNYQYTFLNQSIPKTNFGKANPFNCITIYQF